MKQVIFKQVLELTDTQTVNLPPVAQFLSVQIQNGKICVWFLTEKDRPPNVPYQFEVIGTGNLIPHGNRNYIGTVLDGSFVWHVFVDKVR